MEVGSEIFEKAFAELMVILNVNLNVEREVWALAHAIKYAENEPYYPNPKGSVQKIYNEIFLTRATCYYRRKMLPINEIRESNNIRGYEVSRIFSLKSQLHPLPVPYPLFNTNPKNIK